MTRVRRHMYRASNASSNLSANQYSYSGTLPFFFHRFSNNDILRQPSFLCPITPFAVLSRQQHCKGLHDPRRCGIIKHAHLRQYAPIDRSRQIAEHDVTPSSNHCSRAHGSLWLSGEKRTYQNGGQHFKVGCLNCDQVGLSIPRLRGI
jgi:hypothetical protein